MDMTNIIEKKINIGISACMYGAKVRYNKKGWDMLGYLKREVADFIWHPVCPEVMSGMGVPRNPISLRGGNGHDFWNGSAKIKSRSGKNVGELMKFGCSCCMETLKRAGVYIYIFMEGSPSCGVYRTTLKNHRLGHPPGVFGSLLLNEEFFLIPAQDLQSPIKWWDWRRRLQAFIWLKELDIDSKETLYTMWHTLKFLCQEIDEVSSRKLGNEIANFSKEVDRDTFKEIRRRILLMLRKPSSLNKIKQSLWKNYSFLRKNKNIQVEGILDPTMMRNMHHIAEELLNIERAAYEYGTFFGSAPIAYRPSR